MFLAVDVGNSQTSFGLFEKESLLKYWTLQTRPERTASEYAAFLFPLFADAEIDRSQIDGVALCSVVPFADPFIRDFSADFLELSVFEVTHSAKLGFSLGVDFPEEVGADRLANVAYAVHCLPLPAIIVDLGTATTVDVITKPKVYGGGLILPGIAVAFQSLYQKTAKLPSVPIVFPKNFIGKNTQECVQSGILNGYSAMIDTFINRIHEEMGEKATAVLTGGLAPLIHPQVRVPCELIRNLTLKGIAKLYLDNVSSHLT